MSESTDPTPSGPQGGLMSWLASHRRRALAIGVFTLGARLLYLLVAGKNAGIHPGTDAVLYDQFARMMLSGWQWVTTPFAIREPLYPAFIALCYALPGGDIGVLLFFHAALGAAATALLYLGIRRLVGEPVAVLSALLVAVNLHFIGWTAIVLRENLIVPLLTGFLVSFLLAAAAPGRLRWFVCMLLFVLLCHTDVRFLPLVVVIPVMLLAYQRQLAMTVRQTLWIALFFVLLMIPYQIRGYVAMGKPVIITDRFLGKWLTRTAKQVGADETTVAVDKRADWLRRWEAKKRASLDQLTAEERDYFLAGGRPRTDRLGVHGFLVREYWRFARFRPEYRPYPDGRFADPWSMQHTVSSILAMIPFFILFPFVFVGASRALRRVTWPLLIFLLAHFLMHVVVHARERYRIPLEVITSIFIAIALVNLWGMWKRRRTPVAGS